MKRTALVIASITFLTSASVSADSVIRNFQAPPDEARPLTWWHWLNGNVEKHGIDQDLDWMKSAGIGGVQLFDGSLLTPEIVSERKVFASPAWREAIRHAAHRAHKNGLSMSITTSPGWSAAGGPWVTPEMAMKKVVWSATDIQGGKQIRLKLEAPPAVAGSYQDAPANGKPGPGFYRDTLVLAYRIPTDGERKLPSPTEVVTSVSGIGAQQIHDTSFAKPLPLPYDEQGRAWVDYRFETTQRIRSVTVSVPAPSGFGTPTPPTAILLASDDGNDWVEVTRLPPTKAAQRTASFAVVEARRFRLLLEPTELAEALRLPKPAPGVVGPPSRPFAKVYNMAGFELHSEARIHRFQEKAGFAAAPDYYAIDSAIEVPGSAIVPEAVVNLTSRMNSDGELSWNVPQGEWRILRLGYSLTGHTNGPAVPEATGLEVDKLNSRHVRAYFDHYLGLFQQALGERAFGADGLVQQLLADSIESGPQNWTDDMVEQFKRLRGYDPVPWLPALTGVIVQNAAASDRFLWDFRKTIADLYQEQYYAEIAKIAFEHGMSFTNEALEDNRPQLGDDMAMRRHANVPMGAMWALPADDQAYGRPTYLADVLGAASVSHLYGQNRAGAEIFGAFLRPWDYTPRDLKRTADLAFALGINVFSIHTSVHQPTDDDKPGLSLAPFLGQNLTRKETWAGQAGPWLTYLARSAYLLRQGTFQADVAYFFGEEAPLTALYGQGLPADLSRAHGFDFVNADSLQDALSVQDNKLVALGGTTYSVLYLGGTSSRMTLRTLERIASLVEQGATVVGERPAASPSLADDASKFERVASRLWPASAPGSTRVGKGLVVSGVSLEEALAKLNIAKDVDIKVAEDPAAVWTQHRRLADGSELYFISNQLKRPQVVQVSFRNAEGTPEIWRADEGKAYSADFVKEQGRTGMTLSLDEHDAVFVVFRSQPSQPLEAPSRKLSEFSRLEGAWTLSLTDPAGAPVALQARPGQSWTQSADERLRYFSGTATYSHQFEAPGIANKRVYLDLGDVRDIAQVKLNGENLRTLWTAPYRIEVTNELRAGLNTLEIAVTNPWKNRLIGDVRAGKQGTTQAHGGTYDASAALRDAGLLSPVRLLVEEVGAR